MLWNALTHIHKILGRPRCSYFDGAFHFDLDPRGDWTLAVSADSASRLRLATCHLGSERATFWASEGDRERFTTIAFAARDEVSMSTAEFR